MFPLLNDTQKEREQNFTFSLTLKKEGKKGAQTVVFILFAFFKAPVRDFLYALMSAPLVDKVIPPF